MNKYTQYKNSNKCCTPKSTLATLSCDSVRMCETLTKLTLVDNVLTFVDEKKQTWTYNISTGEETNTTLTLDEDNLLTYVNELADNPTIQLPRYYTDGTINTVQNRLNLIAGDNIVITDGGNGDITIDSTGGEETDTNFALNDLTADNDRFHSWNGANLTIDNISELTLDAGYVTFTIGATSNAFRIQTLPVLETLYSIYYDPATGQLSYGDVPAGGGGSTYTADNALNENVSGNFQLGTDTAPGAPLLHDTFINNDAYSLVLEGAKDVDDLFKVTNTGTSGRAILGSSTGGGFSGYGVKGVSTNNIAIVAEGGVGGLKSTGGVYGVQAFSPANALMGNVTDTTPFSTTIVLNLGKTGGAPYNGQPGVGVTTIYGANNSVGSLSTIGYMDAVFTNTTVGTITGKYVYHLTNLSTSQEVFTLHGSGRTQLNIYGDGFFTGTPTYWLGVDIDGNIVEVEEVLEYADNAAATGAGLQVGTIYRTGDFLKIVH